MKNASGSYQSVLRIASIALVVLFAACDSLPSLPYSPNQIRWVDRTESKTSRQAPEPVPVDSALLRQHWSKGSQLFLKSDWRPAIAEFSAALELVPTNARILVARGWAHAKVSEERLALNDFRQALKHEELAEAHIGIAELMKAALPRLVRRSEIFGAHGQGRYHYQRAIAMHPNNEYLYYGLATLNYMHHHHEYASPPIALRYPLHEVQRALQLRPDFVEALILEALIQSELGQEAAAVRAADRVLALRPEMAEAYYIRGLVMSRTQNRTQAVAFARKALDLDPGNMKYRRAIEEWQRPASLTWGQIAGAMTAMLLGAFLTSDSGPYTGTSSPPYDPWGPNGYLNNWHNSIMMGTR